MYVPMRGLGAELTQADQSIVLQAKQALPKCWGQEVDQCVNTEGGTDYPNCALLNQAWDLDEDAMQAAALNVPFCSESSGTPWGLLALAAVGGLAVGYIAKG